MMKTSYARSKRREHITISRRRDRRHVVVEQDQKKSGSFDHRLREADR